MTNEAPQILLTGATGYVGGRLLNRLEAEGRPVRCLVRNPDHLAQRVAATTELVQADLLQADTLTAALEGIYTCFYLVHSMGRGGNFEALDKQAAHHFGAAAQAAGVKRIIYLGGLGNESKSLSSHLSSRHEVGHILRSYGILTIEFRASIVIGSGSLSYEMIRDLTEKLPIMVTPQWVKKKAQPIGIRDLLSYLMAAMDLEISESTVFEIGGRYQVSYAELMAAYARIRGLKRVMLPIPVLTPWLSSLWLGLVTPLFARVGRTLIDSIRHATVVKDDRALREFDVDPMGVEAMIEAALRNESSQYVETRWSDAISAAGLAQNRAYGGQRHGSRLIDSRTLQVNRSVEAAFQPISKLGGDTGWYAYDGLWQLRGLLDMLLGGVGMRRKRPVGRDLRVGDSLDFWRVEVYEPPHRLRLRAEMKVPGKAWLEFEVHPIPGGAEIRQTAEFYPRGLLGLAYWYGIYPIHVLVFRGMLKAIAARAG